MSNIDKFVFMLFALWFLIPMLIFIVIISCVLGFSRKKHNNHINQELLEMKKFVKTAEHIEYSLEAQGFIVTKKIVTKYAYCYINEKAKEFYVFSFGDTERKGPYKFSDITSAEWENNVFVVKIQKNLFEDNPNDIIFYFDKNRDVENISEVCDISDIFTNTMCEEYSCVLD